MTNMTIFFVSVASLANKITETTDITVISSRQLNKIGFNNFMKKCHDNPLIQCQNVSLLKILNKTVMWRHNGFFYYFLCGTLTSSKFVYFSSNWHIMFFTVCLCVGLQTSSFRYYLQFNMADQNGENDR